MNYKYTNELIKESSPYLLQHAHNPVNWVAWSNKVIEKAQKENKLILISIGYSACHWCHVMEHESFENEQIANYMNEHFICVKVDREERPDIDDIYMTAVQLLTGRGGWPLNCFALPNGEAFWGGTYFKPEQWLLLLKNVVQTYKQQKDSVLSNALEIRKGIEKMEQSSTGAANLQVDLIRQSIDNWKSYFDWTYGGLNQAPKFPMPNNYKTLLQIAQKNKYPELIDFVILTLNKMLSGGLYDQLEGGFARYSTDVYWLVPHFEKMLYDNAQLVSLYSEAYKFSKEDAYKRIVYETLRFIENNFSGTKGNFYSSYDADSEGKEGAYYVWTIKEIGDILADDADDFIAYYRMTEKGNFEGKNILHTKGIDEPEKINLLKKKVLEVRKKRELPGLDDKSLTAWNALMCSAYIDAYRAFGENKFYEKALLSIDFLIKIQLKDEYRLYRNYKKGKSSIPAFLDDYALLIEALIKFYQISFDEQYLFLAQNLTEFTLKHFFDREKSLFFFTPDYQDDIIIRKKELDDNVIPSSNSIMAKNLFLLAKYFVKNDYLELSELMLRKVQDKILKNPMYHSNWLSLYDWHTGDFNEIVVSGEKSDDVLRELQKNYLANCIFAKAGEHSEIPLCHNRFSKELKIYLCRNNTCGLPVSKIDDLKM